MAGLLKWFFPPHTPFQSLRYSDFGNWVKKQLLHSHALGWGKKRKGGRTVRSNTVGCKPASRSSPSHLGCSLQQPSALPQQAAGSQHVRGSQQGRQGKACFTTSKFYHFYRDINGLPAFFLSPVRLHKPTIHLLTTRYQLYSRHRLLVSSSTTSAEKP